MFDDTPVIGVVNGKPLEKGLTRLNESEANPVYSAELTMVPKSGSNEVAFFIDRDVNQRVKLSVTCDPPLANLEQIVSVQVNREEPVRLPWHAAKKSPAESSEHAAMLEAKPNAVRINFFNKASDSKPTTIRLSWRADLDRRRRLVHLNVGVGEYVKFCPKAPDLNCAPEDAAKLFAAFQAQKGRLFTAVLADPNLQGPAIDQSATKDNLLKRLRWMKNQAQPDCFVIVTLSGHGLKVDNDRFFFLCHGYTDKDGLEPASTSLAWEDFRQYFEGMPCPVVVVMDTCHSGAITLNRMPATPAMNSKHRLPTPSASWTKARTELRSWQPVAANKKHKSTRPGDMVPCHWLSWRCWPPRDFTQVRNRPLPLCR